MRADTNRASKPAISRVSKGATSHVSRAVISRVSKGDTNRVNRAVISPVSRGDTSLVNKGGISVSNPTITGTTATPDTTDPKTVSIVISRDAPLLRDPNRLITKSKKLILQQKFVSTNLWPTPEYARAARQMNTSRQGKSV